jgi:hypothetical protein
MLRPNRTGSPAGISARSSHDALMTTHHKCCRPAILNQLELPLGIVELSDEERVRRWLADQPEDSHDSIVVALLLADDESRCRRATKWMELHAAQEPYRADSYMSTGGTAGLAILGLGFQLRPSRSCRDLTSCSTAT